MMIMSGEGGREKEDREKGVGGKENRRVHCKAVVAMS